MSKTIAVLATLDTKGREAGLVCEEIKRLGHEALLIDAGVLGKPALTAQVRREAVAEAGGTPLAELQRANDRGQAVATMASGAAAIVRGLVSGGRIHGLLALGGSAGSSIGAAAMHDLPVGFPKLMVSTMASGDTRPYVGTKDVTLMYSVVDIAGLNRLSRRILTNAAGAICGMATVTPRANDDRPMIAATMFGVTTPCVTKAREILERAGYEVLVFHATGSGGQAMEGLIEDGYFAGVLDITTTEWADELVGGVLSAGPRRLEAAGRVGAQQIVSVGSLDMVNFGPRETVPERFRDRKFHVHNPTVTLMRTTPNENRELGRIIAEKLNAASGLTTVVLPLRGVSALDRPGASFDDPAAREALFAALRQHLKPQVRRVEVDAHINDDAFAACLVDELLALLNVGTRA